MYWTQSARRFVDGPVEVGSSHGPVDDIPIEERIVIVLKVETSSHPVREVDQGVVTVEVTTRRQFALGLSLVLFAARARTVARVGRTRSRIAIAIAVRVRGIRIGRIRARVGGAVTVGGRVRSFLALFLLVGIFDRDELVAVVAIHLDVGTIVLGSL